jgi:8-oxo-dGTP pyrophosphatase MutT (NUDIX family)
VKKPTKYHTVGAFIFTDAEPVKVLLVHHKQLDVWLQPGGSQELHENPIEAVAREVREETGLDISSFLGVIHPIDATVGMLPRPKYLLEEYLAARGKRPEHYCLDQIYVVRIPEQVVTNNKRESHDTRWFAREELGALKMLDSTRTLLNQEMSQL